MPKTKSFRVAVAGDTVDGRIIEEQWLKDIAATYNRATYGARVNKEHIVGLSGTEPFKCYGDVLSCSTEDVTLQIGGKPVKKLALNAEIEANDDLVALVGNGQKVYTSIEVAPNFANTGKAGLVGLAVTDTPASLGTEVLTFAVKHPGLSPSLPRARDAANVFSLGMETAIELAAAPAADTETAGLMASAKAFFDSFRKSDQQADTPRPPVGTTPPANDNDARFAAVGSGLEKMTAAIERMGGSIATLSAEIAGVKRDHAAFKAEIETSPVTLSQRTTSAGGNGALATDC